jgi:ascorbate-specific PTS system EIIC-type component UlaA
VFCIDVTISFILFDRFFSVVYVDVGCVICSTAYSFVLNACTYGFMLTFDALLFHVDVLITFRHYESEN